MFNQWIWKLKVKKQHKSTSFLYMYILYYITINKLIPMFTDNDIHLVVPNKVLEKNIIVTSSMCFVIGVYHQPFLLSFSFFFLFFSGLLTCLLIIVMWISIFFKLIWTNCDMFSKYSILRTVTYFEKKPYILRS